MLAGPGDEFGAAFGRQRGAIRVLVAWGDNQRVEVGIGNGNAIGIGGHVHQLMAKRLRDAEDGVVLGFGHLSDDRLEYALQTIEKSNHKS